MNWKETYTKIFLQQSQQSINKSTLKEYTTKWWKNTRKEGGLRLTDKGFQFISEELELQNYSIPYPKDFEFTTQVIIWMDNFIDCPYYLDHRKIIVTNEKKALELHLFSGDIKKYGISKALSRQKDS